MALGAETSGRNPQKTFWIVCRATKKNPGGKAFVRDFFFFFLPVILQTDKQTNQCRQNMTTFGKDNICMHLKMPARLLKSKNCFNYSFVAELRLEKIQGGEIYIYDAVMRCPFA